MSKYAFIGPSYESRSPNADKQTTINLYPETVESGAGKNRKVLYGTPGLSLFGTLGAGPVRGLWAGEGRLFAVSGTTLYEVSSGGVGTSLGTVASDGAPAYMYPNGTQLFVVSGGSAYLHNGTTLASAPVPGAPGASGAGGAVGTASSGCYLDGYFIAAKPGTKVFFISALNDGLTWDALDFASKEGYPDAISSVLADHRELWLFGTHKSTEVWRNEGDPDFPFRPDPGGFQHYGLAAKHSVCNFASGVAWLGGDTRGRVAAFRSQGFQPVRISNYAVEETWRGYGDISGAVGYTYLDSGHEFYVLTFASATWVYDLTENVWHQRGVWNGTGYDRFPGWVHAFAFGKHIVGDHTSGKLYEMSLSTGTYEGATIRRERIAPHMCEEQKNLFFHKFQLDLETGVGAAELFADLSWSDDGGRTWTTAVTRSAGVSGDYDARVIWRRLGSARDRLFKVTVTADRKIAMIDAYYEATPGHA